MKIVSNLSEKEKEELLEVMFNLFSGVQLEDLCEDEIRLLTKAHGEDWKKELGYEK